MSEKCLIPLASDDVSSLEKVFSALNESGYDPVEQLSAYIETGDVRYITRTDGARDIIQKIRKEDIETYLKLKNKT